MTKAMGWGARACAALAFTVAASAAGAVDLRFGLADDPDALDPVTNRTQVGVTVLSVMCDKLVNIGPDMIAKPGLAAGWTWSADSLSLTLDLADGILFQDGTKFDAQAVKVNIERAQQLKTSTRKDDASSIAKVEVEGPLKVKLTLNRPDASLLGKLAERLGMMMSPAAIEKLGDNFGREPVCAGPYKFVQRVAQDRIVLEKVPTYKTASAYSFDRVIFRILTDDAVRLANLQAGGVDIIEKLDPSTAATVEANKAFQLIPVDSMNNQALMFNLAGRYADRPMAKDPRVREAFELSLDRDAIVKVAFAGRYMAANQFAAPGTPYYNDKFPVPKRDVAKARALLRAAGHTAPVPFTILVPNRPLPVRVAEMIQAMSNEAGFDTKLQVVDFATTLNMTDKGDFEAWGPIGPQFANDPDNVSFQVLHSTGNRNVGKYKSEALDKALEESRRDTDPQRRIAHFRAAAGVIAQDRPVIYLYHQRPLLAATAKLKGLRLTADGFVQLDGATLQ